MDYGNLNLRSKTFLDFTDDPAALDEIIGGHGKTDREDFLLAVSPDNSAGEQERAMTFMAFADLCTDKRLAEAIRAEFGKEYRAIFNE